MLSSNSSLLKIISLLILGSGFILAQPKWVENRPADNEHYTGIAGVSISRSGTDYKSIAKAKALSDMASEITVNVNSDFFTKTVEKAQLVQSEAQVTYSLQAAAEFDEYEFVADYSADDIYWIYLRVSKVAYAAAKQKKIDIAKKQSESSYKKAKQLLKIDDITGSLQNLVSALLSLQKVFTEPIETQINGSGEILQELIINELQSVISNVSIDKPVISFSGKYNDASKETIPIKVIYSIGAKKSPVASMPFQLAVQKGNFRVPGTLKSDASGKLEVRINPILSQEKKQTASLFLSLSALSSKDTINPLLTGILKSIKSPVCDLTLNLDAYKVCIVSSETNVGNSLLQKVIEPVIQSKLATLGFAIVAPGAATDFEVVVDASAAQFSTAYNQFICMAAGSLSFRNKNTGEVIFSKSFQNVKGVQLDYEKAGLKALTLLSTQFAGELNDTLLNSIFRITN